VSSSVIRLDRTVCDAPLKSLKPVQEISAWDGSSHATRASSYFWIASMSSPDRAYLVTFLFDHLQDMLIMLGHRNHRKQDLALQKTGGTLGTLGWIYFHKGPPILQSFKQPSCQMPMLRNSAA